MTKNSNKWKEVFPNIDKHWDKGTRDLEDLINNSSKIVTMNLIPFFFAAREYMKEKTQHDIALMAIKLREDISDHMKCDDRLICPYHVVSFCKDKSNKEECFVLALLVNFEAYLHYSSHLENYSKSNLTVSDSVDDQLQSVTGKLDLLIKLKKQYIASTYMSVCFGYLSLLLNDDKQEKNKSNFNEITDEVFKSVLKINSAKALDAKHKKNREIKAEVISRYKKGKKFNKWKSKREAAFEIWEELIKNNETAGKFQTDRGKQTMYEWIYKYEKNK